MPELPEVETVRKQLESEILGAIVQGVVIRETKIFIGDSKQLLGDKIVEVKRLGKYIFLFFESKKGLVIHLKMTGRLVLDDQFYEDAKHTRVVISLRDGRKIYYWDTRKFGYLRLENDIEFEHGKLAKKIGPEPWDITDLELLRKLKRTGRSIKETILDQSILAGVGNIYANDALWLARINPTKKANAMTKTEVAKLRNSLCTVLTRGIAVGGASDNTYRDFYGGRGSYQDEFLVYGRTGQPCNNCGTALMRIVVGGRGTWVCSKCQNYRA